MMQKKKEKLKYRKKTNQKLCNLGMFEEFKNHTPIA